MHTTRHILTTALASAALCALAPAAAGAQSEAEITQAQEAFDEGSAAYAAEDFGAAAAAFRKAYQIVPAAMFLYNEAKARRQLGQYDRAVDLLKRADAQAELPLPPPVKEKVAGLILEIRSEQEDARAAAAAAQARRERERQRALELEQARRRYQVSWVGWGGVTAGTVGVILLGAAGVRSRQISQDFAALSSELDRARYDREVTRLEGEQSTGRVFLFTGASLTLLGAGLFGWDFFTRGETPWSVSLELAPGAQTERRVQLGIQRRF